MTNRKGPHELAVLVLAILALAVSNFICASPEPVTPTPTPLATLTPTPEPTAGAEEEYYIAFYQGCILGLLRTKDTEDTWDTKAVCKVLVLTAYWNDLFQEHGPPKNWDWPPPTQVPTPGVGTIG